MTDDTIKSKGSKKIGSFLICSPGTLNHAVKMQGNSLKSGEPVKRIGKILLDNGVITEEELETAIKKQRTDRLHRSPVFAELTNIELAAISSHFIEVSVFAGEQFIIQDESDPTLYILAAGKVQVYCEDSKENKIHIAYVEPPEPIGEMGYFAGGKRTASVRAVETTQLLRAYYSNLTNYFENVPHVALAFTQIVERRRLATATALAIQKKS